MARLTYGALALALGALVAGFFVRTTAVPLFASIGLSALVLILILRGWARRMRQTAEFDQVEVSEEITDIEAEEILVVEPGDESADLPVLARRAAAIAEERERERRERVPRERPARRPRARTGSGAGSRRVVVLPGRTRYHTPDCRFAHGKGAEEISESTARRRRFQPCSVCLGG